jgi:hypothetical protein
MAANFIAKVILPLLKAAHVNSDEITLGAWRFKGPRLSAYFFLWRGLSVADSPSKEPYRLSRRGLIKYL